MEALEAVGLAGNIVQFIQFSCELLSLSSNIKSSDDGFSSSHSDLHTIAKDLREHSAKLSAVSPSNRSVNDLATRSKSVAKDLLSALEEIRGKMPQEGSGRCGSYRQALKAIWKRDKIESLLSRLEKLRDQAALHLISETR